MTLNEIKKNALALMFANYEDDLSETNVDEVTNDEYKRYLVNMNAVINRALSRIQSAGVLADKSYEVTSTDGDAGLVRLDLATLISDFWRVSRVIYQSKSAYIPYLSFSMEGNTIVLPKLKGDDKYIVMYKPKIDRIALTAASNTEINIPNEVADLIPYFIKSELYEEDEPKLAVQARNIFEAMLEDLKRDEYASQEAVINVFAGVC